MTNQNAALAEIYQEIQSVARITALEWPDVVEADDVAQEIAVRLLDFDYAVTVYELEPRARRRTLNIMARQVASGERVDYEHFTGQYRYSTDEVRSRLESGALVDVGYDVVPGSGPEPTAEFSVEDVDIRTAYERIDWAHRNVLNKRYWWGQYDGHSQYVTRAVDALTAELNRAYRRDSADYDGPGARRAVSNAKAHVMNRQQETRA